MNLERKINEKLTDGMAAVALAADQTIHQLMEHHGSKTSSAGKSSASNTTAANDSTTALLALLTKLDSRLAKLEAKGSGGGGGGGGGQGNGSSDRDGGAETKTDSKVLQELRPQARGA